MNVGDARARALWIGALLVVPALLFAPVLYYSLDSPLRLIDDYVHWRYLRILESPSSFLTWIEWVVGIDEVGWRYRPTWQLYNAIVWKWFGADASAHHLIRWILHFGAVAFFCAAFCRICSVSSPSRPPGNRRSATGHLLPLAMMLHVWLFFPNLPAVQLGTQDTLTVFFLGVCNYAAAVALSWESQRRAYPENQATARWRWLYGLFVFGFLGLAFSKEVNVALALFLLVAYFVFACLVLKTGWRGAVAGLPLVAIGALAATRVYAATESSGVGYGNAWSAYTSMTNAAKMLLGLFQVQTSALVAAGFVALLGALAFGHGAGALRMLRPKDRRKDREPGGHGGTSPVDCELAFVLLLAGQFTCLFLILAASWGMALRYWYPLVPLLSMLLAFGAKFVLQAAGRRPGWSERRLAWPLIAFVVFFVACNYYNFAFQTIAWHSLGKAEEALIEEVRRLGDQGEHVVVEGTGDEHECSLVYRVRDYLAFFHGIDFAAHLMPPEAGPYYFVTQKELPEQEKATTIPSRRDYALLTAAGSVASALQLRREPFRQLDANVKWNRDGRPYVWNIYRVPASVADGRPRWPELPTKPCNRRR